MPGQVLASLGRLSVLVVHDEIRVSIVKSAGKEILIDPTVRALVDDGWWQIVPEISWDVCMEDRRI